MVLHTSMSTGIDTRATILGHVQRGGSPTLRDRVNASAMGYHAVCLLEQGKYNRIVGKKGEHLVDYPVDEALEMTKTLDPVLIDVCNTISIVARIRFTGKRNENAKPLLHIDFTAI